jgi:hypothetical protein
MKYIYSTVIPTKVGTQEKRQSAKYWALSALFWVPTFVGMTAFFKDPHQ